VYPKGKGLHLQSLDDPILKKLRIGVHLLGDDYTNPPPVHELAKRGIVDNVVGFDTFYSAENPPSTIVDAAAAGKIGAAIVWGPTAGYFVLHQRVPLEVVPIPSGKTDLPFAFDISMGVRPGNDLLKGQLEKVLVRKQTEIQNILKHYGVPLLDRATGKVVTP
jgi:mxaJ protein